MQEKKGGRNNKYERIEGLPQIPKDYYGCNSLESAPSPQISQNFNNSNAQASGFNTNRTQSGNGNGKGTPLNQGDQGYSSGNNNLNHAPQGAPSRIASVNQNPRNSSLNAARAQGPSTPRTSGSRPNSRMQPPAKPQYR